MYIIPTTELIKMQAESVLVALSGPGFNDGGKDDGSQSAQSPRRPF